MRAVDVIRHKRDGGTLDRDEIAFFIDGVTNGSLPDYQAAALLMAILIRGMSPEETAALTDAMVRSGVRVDYPDIGGTPVDKHSTGGVGDKTSLILAPLAAACGAYVPMMSGRGLGHTGGTLDKLESIPGFRTTLSLAEATRQLERIGCAMIGQSAEIAPADRKMYALRDATSTVESVPLIAASIMSKKLAEGLTGLVLDVKRGAGAFLPDLDRELELAQTMINLGEDRGCTVVALITAMDRPLGRACGNALEVEEAIHTLRGEGPPDVLGVTYALGAEMLVVGGVAANRDAARRAMEVAISSGKAARKFEENIEAKGGNPGVVDDPAVLPQAHACELFLSSRSGVIARVEPRVVGRGVTALGGGRTRMDDTVDPSVGFVITAKPGDVVQQGEPLATVFARDRAGVETGLAALRQAISIADEAELPLPLISHRVTANGVTSFEHD